MTGQLGALEDPEAGVVAPSARGGAEQILRNRVLAPVRQHATMDGQVNSDASSHIGALAGVDDLDGQALALDGRQAGQPTLWP